MASSAGLFDVGERGHVLVPVSVDGGDARPFVLDTAASQTVLDPAAFPALGTQDAPAGHALAAHGAHGTVAARMTRLSTLSLWEAEQKDQVAFLMPLVQLTRGVVPDFAGVLGIPFLRRYRIDLDFPGRSVLLIEDPDRAAPCDICTPAAVIAVTPLHGELPTVQVMVNGQVLTALLDTGASSSIVNDAAAELLGLAPSGSDDATSSVLISLGDMPPRRHELRRIELPVFRQLRLESEPAMILGIDFLRAGRLVLDLAGRKAWFHLPPGTSG